MLLRQPTSVNDLDADGGRDGPDDTVATLGGLLNVLIGALEEHGIEPIAGSVGAAGFTIVHQGHRLRVGFGVTSRNDPRADWPSV
jgi:hypothetical protein